MSKEGWTRREVLIAGGFVLAGVAVGGVYGIANALGGDSGSYLNYLGAPNSPTPDNGDRSIYVPQFAADDTLLDYREQFGPVIDFGVPKKLLPTGSYYNGCAIPGDVCKPSAIVIHVTDDHSTTAEELYQFLLNSCGSGNAQGGPQFIVGQDGVALQIAESYKNGIGRAWNVANYPNVIGIENNHWGDFTSLDDADPRQVNALLDLVLKLMYHYNIPLGVPYSGDVFSAWKAPSNDAVANLKAGVLGHYQLNPDGRTDPGQVFFSQFRKLIASKTGQNPYEP